MQFPCNLSRFLKTVFGNHFKYLQDNYALFGDLYKYHQDIYLFDNLSRYLYDVLDNFSTYLQDICLFGNLSRCLQNIFLFW